MDILRRELIRRHSDITKPVVNYEIISRLLFRVDKRTASKLLEQLSGLSAWRIYELYKVEDMRHILLDYYGGRLCPAD